MKKKHTLSGRFLPFIPFLLAGILFASPLLVLSVIKLTQMNLHSAAVALYHALITLLLFSLLPALFPIKLRNYLFLSAPLLFFTPMLVYCVLLFEKMPTRGLFFVLLESTSNERAEFLHGMWLLKSIVILLPALIILVNWRFTPQKLNITGYRIHFLIGFFSLILAGSAYELNKRSSFERIVQQGLYACFRDTPVGIARRSVKALKTYRAQNRKVGGETEDYSVLADSSVKEIPTLFVLVIGESSRYKNWGLNGYERQTSPQLQSYPALISFSKVISPSFNTRESVPILLTGCTDSCQHSLMAFYAKTEYETFWLGNQQIKAGPVDLLAQQADVRKQTAMGKYTPYDGELLEPFNKVISSNKSSGMIVLHTMGSHYPFQNRYPEEFEQFKPATKKNRHIPLKQKHRETILNNYDNSILYTDFFLSELIASLKQTKRPAVLLYVSDHGENLFEDASIGFGRGLGKISPELYHVPLFIWCSDSYCELFPEKYQALQKNQSQPTSTTAVFHTLLHMGGISGSQVDSTQSLASVFYESKERKVILKGRVHNYDSLFANKKLRGQP